MSHTPIKYIIVSVMLIFVTVNFCASVGLGQVEPSWPLGICSEVCKVMVFPVVMYGCESWTVKKAEKLMLLNCGVAEDS